MDIFSQEFAAGAILVIVGAIALKLQQCHWYREKFFTGYWKSYNTPFGLFLANLQCAAIVVVGLAMCLRFISFDR